MSERDLKIFELYGKLAELLGDKEAIADLTILLERHPEMFRDKQDLEEVIQKVINEPEIIIKNPNARSDKDFIAAKQLDNKKMGDVGLRNDSGINVIFHANKKKIEEFERLQDKIEKGKVQVVGTPTSYTQAQSLDGLVQENSSPAEPIIPQTTNQCQSTEDPILQRALELQTKQQKGELENFFTHQEENTNESKSKKGEKQS
ncbi:hypothetical protein CCZ01_09725 [Helicobacter monodelphidis]|uniref:hypothetical protein n=1 Tax=Helicobacter sp. 15-1451 TaxID=2004995 RepID=UPI000DCD826E|nr:hypothetical protein [Helicobacter sp. 15-1451]RAX56227.1 hypothetical protein CCZ01_09725 [Helicobacter sp. 15-1451]